MEILAAVLLLIFILHLIDKHNRWRAAIKATAALVVLALLGFGGLYGWVKYSDWRDQKKEEAEARTKEAKGDACIARMKAASKDWSDSTQANARTICDGNPDAPGEDESQWVDVTPLPPRGYVLDAPKKQHGKYNLSDIDKTKLLCTYGQDLTTQEYGDLTVGSVKDGETVTLLSDDGSRVRVKKDDGTVGWAAAFAFKVIKGN